MRNSFFSEHKGRKVLVKFGRDRMLGWYLYMFLTTAEAGDPVYASDGRSVGEIEEIIDCDLWKVRDGKNLWFLRESSGYTVEDGISHYERVNTSEYEMLRILSSLDAPEWAMEKVRLLGEKGHDR